MDEGVRAQGEHYTKPVLLLFYRFHRKYINIFPYLCEKETFISHI